MAPRAFLISVNRAEISHMNTWLGWPGWLGQPDQSGSYEKVLTYMLFSAAYHHLHNRLMLCDASGAEFGLMQRRGPGVELAQNAWTVAK